MPPFLFSAIFVACSPNKLYVNFFSFQLFHFFTNNESLGLRQFVQSHEMQKKTLIILKKVLIFFQFLLTNKQIHKRK